MQQSRKTVKKIEWRLQDVSTGRIMPRVYLSEKRALWHQNRFNLSGLQFNSSLRTKAVQVKATYSSEWVLNKIPILLEVL